MPSIQEYRQEKYEKYNSLDEGKLFYRHEKYLDLVNTIEDVLYVLQEENPWIKLGGRRELQYHANKFPEPIKPHIAQKIDKSYEKGMAGSVWNADIRIHKIIKMRTFKKNVKKFLWHELGFVHPKMDKELTDNIQCFCHAGVAVFFFDQSDRSKLMDIINDGKSAGGIWYNNKVIFLPQQENNTELEKSFNHEYQHYLYRDLLAPQKDSKDLHYNITDEICATLTDMSFNNEDDTVNQLSKYIYKFCNIDQVLVGLPRIGIQGGFIPNIIALKDGKIVQDKDSIQNIMKSLVYIPGYVQIAHRLIDFFETIPELHMNRSKAIHLLSMISPDYRAKLLQYYTKLAQHITQK